MSDGDDGDVVSDDDDDDLVSDGNDGDVVSDDDDDDDVVVVVSGMQLTIAWRHTSTSSSTEGGSEPNLLLRGA